MLSKAVPIFCRSLFLRGPVVLQPLAAPTDSGGTDPNTAAQSIVADCARALFHSSFMCGQHLKLSKCFRSIMPLLAYKLDHSIPRGDLGTGYHMPPCDPAWPISPERSNVGRLADGGLPSDPSLGPAWRVSCWLSSLRLEVRTLGAFGRSDERVMWVVLTCCKGNEWGTMEVSLGSTLWWCHVLHGWTNQPFSSFYFVVFTCSYH